MSAEHQNSKPNTDGEYSSSQNPSSLDSVFNFYARGELTNQMARENMVRLEPSENQSEAIARRLAGRVVGQDEACNVVARRVALAKSGLGNPRKPLSAIFELGPTGVGKTEMAHALADELFGDPYSDRLMIINMGEYMESHDSKKFVGSPPSYVGSNEKPAIPHDWLHQKKGSITERSIIVFDEVEKAHPRVLDIMLSIMDKGQLQARRGSDDPETKAKETDIPVTTELLDFTDSFLIFTSNIGALNLQKAQSGRTKIGFDSNIQEDQKLEVVGRTSLAEHFKGRPEFIGRLSDIVVFRHLEAEDYKTIFRKMIDEKNNDLKERFHGASPRFVATQEFCEHIMQQLDHKYGARELQTLLDQEMFDKAGDILFGLPSPEVTLVAGYEDGQVIFYLDVKDNDNEYPVQDDTTTYYEDEALSVSDE